MRLTILLLFSVVTISLQAQNAIETSDANFHLNQTDAVELRDGGGGGGGLHTIILYPNPVTDQRINFLTVHISIYSFTVIKSTGEIVEIDNLIGRDPIDGVILPDVPPGLYYISFYTDYGFILRSFTVI